MVEVAEATETQIVTTTPSGMEIVYEWAPKRLYRIDGREVPSVTTVLNVLDKPGLPYWGMKVGIEGTLAMHNMGLLSSVPLGDQKVLATGEDNAYKVAGVDEVLELLTKHKLTVNHVRDKAGDRGKAVHDALEVWAKDGVLPEVGMYPPAEQGYILGLLAFLSDVHPEPESQEVMVGSSEYGFAGRYDVRLRIPQDCQVVFHRTPVKGPQYATLKKGMILTDLKTSKGVYPSHHRQLEAYEQASIESGYEATAARGILHVGAEGTYEFVRSTACFDDFLAVLGVWKSDQRMKEKK